MELLILQQIRQETKELLFPKQSSGEECRRVAEGCDDGPCVCRIPQ